MDTVSTFLRTLLHYSFVNQEMHPVLYSLQESARWFIICAALFIPLASVFAGKPAQPKIHKDMISDSIYWFLSPLIYHPVFIFFLSYLVAGLYAVNSHWLSSNWQSPIALWPIWAQVILMLVSADILQYWVHRAFHKASLLWKFHAIHHSPAHVDWTTSTRFHPVNFVLYSTLMNALVFLLGFSPAAYDALFLFNVIYSPLVHANLNWSYGPFKYVLASPVFHRWHHTYAQEGGNKNFAPTFPILDVMFGTFYMPEGRQPETFGTPDDPITGNIFQQLIYPFMPKAPSPEAPEAQEKAAEAKLS